MILGERKEVFPLIGTVAGKNNKNFGIGHTFRIIRGCCGLFRKLIYVNSAFYTRILYFNDESPQYFYRGNRFIPLLLL